MVTGTPIHERPEWMFNLDGAGWAKTFLGTVLQGEMGVSQSLPPLYAPNGAVYATRRWLLKERGLISSAFSGGNTGYVVMDPSSSLDIDTKIDFMVVEAVLRDRG